MKSPKFFLGLLCLGAFASPVYAEDDDGSVDFQKELLTIQEQVNSLKENVFQSKATLKLLKEIVIQGAVSGSRATVWHVNDLGMSYIIESVSYFVDGQGRYAKSDATGALDDMPETKVFDDAISPGRHTLQVNVNLRGNGFGVFQYVEDYSFKVQSSTVINIEEGQDCQIRVIIDERPGISHSYFERPQVVFEPRCRQMSDVD